MRASLYSSSNIFMYLKEKNGKAPKNEAKEKEDEDWAF